MNFVNFLKRRLIFNIFYRMHILKSKRYFNVKSSTCYLHMKTKILADFQICISVPLKGIVYDFTFPPLWDESCE